VNSRADRRAGARSSRYLRFAALLAAAVPMALLAQMPGGSVGGPNSGANGSDGGNPAIGKSVAAARCASCHGANGNSTNAQYPKLAGQNPAYLYWQIWAFKTGARRSDVMSGIVSALSDADAANVAAYFSEQAIRPDPVTDSSLAREGERIFYARGPHGAPPCAMCHGAGGRGGTPMMRMMGHGMMGYGAAANTPVVSGQHAGYIAQQLDRFASGQRRSTVMGRIAAGLSEADRQAVAAFLSGAR
jgi:cytochrome c553